MAGLHQAAARQLLSWQTCGAGCRRAGGRRRVASRPGRPLLALLLVATGAFATQAAFACGYNFGLRLLADRDRALHTVWEGDFRTEASRLVPAPEGLALADIVDGRGEPVPARRQREHLQAQWLTVQQQQLALAMARADHGQAAWAAGEGLPEAARAYLAGARAWRHYREGGADGSGVADGGSVVASAPEAGADAGAGASAGAGAGAGDDARAVLPATDPGSADDGHTVLTAAATWFTRAAAGQAEASSPWPLLGQYMLARVLAEQAQWLQAEAGDDGEASVAATAAVDAGIEAALVAFAAVRGRVRAGAADPLGLGAASLGESARLHWQRDELAQAAQLYAGHAALGDARAVRSLLEFTTRTVHREDGLQALLAGSPGRELVVLYAWTHAPAVHINSYHEALADAGGQGDDGQGDGGEPEAGAGAAEASKAGASGRRWLELEDILEQLLASLRQRPGLEGADAARMAALAWRQGHFGLAERYHALASGPLADWLGAKLALRAGRPDQAAGYFARAAAAFAPEETWGERQGALVFEPHCHARAQQAVLALSRGELRQSLEMLLYAGGVYWLDAAYVAERVLPTQELLDLVEGLADTPHLQAIGPFSSFQAPAWMDQYRVDSAATQYRFDEEADDGRDDDAYADGEGEIYYSGWLDPVGRVRAVDVPARLRHLLARRLMREGRYGEALRHFDDAAAAAVATGFANALEDAEGSRGRDRARALFAAATLAHDDGLAFLAYETEPDWFVHDGEHLDTAIALPLLAGAAPPAQTRWVHPFEREAIQAQHESVQTRFHYRLVAAGLADRAADELDPAAPAYAAVLCHAALWLMDQEPARARDYYHRYIDTAPPAPWHADFGRQCPVPEFD